jgi:hypothetical protein
MPLYLESNAPTLLYNTQQNIDFIPIPWTHIHIIIRAKRKESLSTSTHAKREKKKKEDQKHHHAISSYYSPYPSDTITQQPLIKQKGGRCAL